MKALLDTNIIVDVLTRREPHFVASSAVWTAIEKGELAGAVTSLTIVTAYYLGQKTVGHATAMVGMKHIRDTLEIVSVGSEDVSAAIDAGWADFEDCVQATAAARSGMDWIVTRDRKGFDRSKIPSILPQELIALLETPGRP